MIWARRVVLGTGLAVASLVVVPGMAGAASNCSTTPATINPSMTPPTPNCPTVPPTVGGNNQVVGNSTTVSSTPEPTPSSSTAGTSSLPFTGADVGELAVIGGAALVAGGILMRRRRTVTA